MSMRALLALFVSFVAIPSAHAAEERARIFLLGKEAGQQVATYAADGSVQVRFAFNDRGRGPEIDARYVLAESGVPTAITITGKNYFKVPVDETYTYADGKARWKNGADDAERALDATRYYLALNGTFEDSALLVRALLAAPEHRLPLLPTGEARLTVADHATFKGKAGAVKATLYAIEGLDLAPSYLWLDDRGRLFASYSNWTVVVREGYEGAIDAIGRRQDAIERKLTVAQARANTIELKRPLLIEPVRVFDPATLAVAEAQGVLVVDGRIAAVGDAGSLALPANTERFDGRGMFLMPGLWDMHQHYTAGYGGPIAIAAGVTTIRDLANDGAALSKAIADIERGDAIGPRVIKAGFIDGRGPYAGPTKVFADDEAEAKAAIEAYAKDGYEQIKVYSSLKPELVAPIAKMAHAHGLRLSGHVPAYMSARDFVAAGADEIQHINFILMSFVTDVATADTRTPVRFTAIAQNAAKLDLGSPAIREWVDFLVAHGTVVDPTISTFEAMFLEQPGHPSAQASAWADRVPPVWQRAFMTGTNGLPMTKEQEGRYRDSYQKMIDMVGVLHRRGVKLVAGTDGMAGLSLVRELEFYVAAGIPPAEALRIATLNGAEVMKRADRYGRVLPGYVADLALVDGDPTLEIGDLRRVHTVVQGTRRFDSAALLTAVGLKPVAPRTR